VQAAERALREQRRRVHIAVEDARARASRSFHAFSGPGSKLSGKLSAALRFGPTPEQAQGDEQALAADASGTSVDTHVHVEHALSGMAAALEAAAAHLNAHDTRLVEAERRASEHEQAHQSTREDMTRRAEAAEARAREAEARAASLVAAGDKTSDDLAKLKTLLKEYTKTNAMLEEEFRQAGLTNGELRTGLSEAEALVLELKNRLRSSEDEREASREETALARSEAQTAHRRLARLELELERVHSAGETARADNEALHTIRRGLEDELEKAHGRLRAGAGSHGD